MNKKRKKEKRGSIAAPAPQANQSFYCYSNLCYFLEAVLTCCCNRQSKPRANSFHAVHCAFSPCKVRLALLVRKILRGIGAFGVKFLPQKNPAQLHAARDGDFCLLLFCSLLDPAFDEIGHRLRNTISLGRHTIVIAIGKHDTHVNWTFAGLARHKKTYIGMRGGNVRVVRMHDQRHAQSFITAPG